MVNPMVDFYRKNSISPVHQDIENFRIHLSRREKLYRKLGMPPVLFKNTTTLEIGPGGGYNALGFFEWGATVDFVEPNPTAQKELALLLDKYGIEKDRWKLFSGSIEDYSPKSNYDVVIAEGFIPGLHDRNSRYEIINKISSLVNPGGVVVVTCVDEISMFFEVLKRLIAVLLTNNIETLQDKVNTLSKAFAGHLQSLKYASRPVEDWVTDQFLNPAIHGELFSIADCVIEFENEFELLGSSPGLFTDVSWYKNIDFGFTNLIIEQFKHKRHNLILWDMEESERNTDLNEALFEACFRVRKLEEQMEKGQSKNIIRDIIGELYEISTLTRDLDRRISQAISEVINLLQADNLSEQMVDEAKAFASAFGRGQQYVSLVKTFTK